MLDNISTAVQNNSLSALLISPAVALPFALVDIDEQEAKALIKGQKVRKCSISNTDKTEKLPLLLTRHDEKLIAICRLAPDGYLSPEIVLADPF